MTVHEYYLVYKDMNNIIHVSSINMNIAIDFHSSYLAQSCNSEMNVALIAYENGTDAVCSGGFRGGKGSANAPPFGGE